MSVRSLSSAINCILKGYPGACVSLLDYSSESAVHRLRMEGGELEVPLINMRFSKKFYLPNNITVLLFLAVLMKAIPSARFRLWITAKNDCLRKIDRIELFTSVAGGDSFSDIYGMARFFYTSLPQVLVLLMGKRLVLLPQTMGPFDRRLSRVIAQYILRHAERVFTRDRNGLREMQALLGTLKPGNYLFCYDLAFFLPSLAPPHVDTLRVVARRRSRPAGCGCEYQRPPLCRGLHPQEYVRPADRLPRSSSESFFAFSSRSEARMFFSCRTSSWRLTQARATGWRTIKQSASKSTRS